MSPRAREEVLRAGNAVGAAVKLAADQPGDTPEVAAARQTLRGTIYEYSIQEAGLGLLEQDTEAVRSALGSA